MATTGWYLEIAVVSALALGGFMLLRRRKAANRSQSCRVDRNCRCGNSPNKCLDIERISNESESIRIPTTSS
jgi:hypothetical protein